LVAFFYPSAFAGSILGWGSQVVDSTELAQKNHIAISAGRSHSLALRSDGTIVGWGYNDWGQATPPAGNDYIAISAGGYYGRGIGGEHSLAIIEQPCLYLLAGDLNDDCKVDFYDFALMAANWLIDCDITPDNPACVPK
jgi:hypothetical protein